MHNSSAVDDRTRCGDRQPVPPFPGEYLSASEKRFRQSNAARMMMTQRAQCHHGQPLFDCLKANIGSIQMESKFRIESQAGVPSDDQQQLVERRDLCGQVWPIAEHSAAVNDPADALGGERLRCVARRDYFADTVHPRDPDRPKLPLGLVELFRDASVPSRREPNILIGADDPVMLRRQRPRFRPSPVLGQLVTATNSFGEPSFRHGELSRFAWRIALSDTHATNDNARTRARKFFSSTNRKLTMRV